MTTFLAKAALCAATTLAFAAPAHAAAVIGGSDLLTPTHAAQMETWLTGDPQLSYSGSLAFTNIYDKAPGDTSADFHAAADGKGPTFFVIEATYTGGGAAQIIGGFNPGSWASSGGNVATPTVTDRVAFIFNLISGTVMHQAQSADGVGDGGATQSQNDGAVGPVMGEGPDLRVNGDLTTGYLYAWSYCLDPAAACYAGTNIWGFSGFTGLNIGAMEVFTIAAAPEVPIPAAAPLLLGALGLTGLIARRRKG